VNVVLLGPVCYFPSCPPLALDAFTLCHLHQGMKHCHVRLVHLPACHGLGGFVQGFEAEVVEMGILSGLEEPEDSLYGFPVGSLSVLVPTSIVITIHNIVRILD
jgi:hypothetical protein